MRVQAAFVLTIAAILAPSLGTADPAQPQPTTTTQPATAAPSANAAASAPATATAQSAQTPVSAAAPSRSTARETVIVTGTAQKDDSANLDRVECRNEPELGSRILGSRECHTLRAWNNRRQNSQAIVNGLQMRGLTEGYAK